MNLGKAIIWDNKNSLKCPSGVEDSWVDLFLDSVNIKAIFAGRKNIFCIYITTWRGSILSAVLPGSRLLPAAGLTSSFRLGAVTSYSWRWTSAEINDYDSTIFVLSF